MYLNHPHTDVESPHLPVTMAKFLIPTLLSFALASSATTCPKDWLANTDLTGDTKCCYGTMLIDGKNAFCCIYDDPPEADPSTATDDSATNTATDDYASWSTVDECAVRVPFTATDYSARVSSASKALQSGATTTARTVASNEATATSGALTSSSASVSVSGTSAAATSNAAGPVATAHEAVLGGAVVLAGLLVL